MTDAGGLDLDQNLTGFGAFKIDLHNFERFAEQDGHDWLVPLPHPTIADVACLPYIALAEEGGIDLAPYPSVARWMERFMRLEKFKPMPGMMPLEMPKETP
ncbi:hypothetical protein NBRC116586_36080 [Pseudooceanicola nitratireducens]